MDIIKDIVLLILSIKFVLCKDGSSYCPSVKNSADSTFIIGDTCYHLVQNSEYPPTRDSARSDCRSRNGDLITIKNEIIQENVTTAINKISDSHTVLLGLKREGNQWKWVDGEVINYSNWKQTTASQLGDCGRLNAMENGRWERIDCTATEWFTVYICEHNAKTQTSGADSITKYSVTTLVSMLVSLLLVWFAHYQ